MPSGVLEIMALCDHGCATMSTSLYGPTEALAVACQMEDFVVHSARVEPLHMKEKKPWNSPSSSGSAWPPQLW